MTVIVYPYEVKMPKMTNLVFVKGNLKSLDEIQKQYGENCIIKFALPDVNHIVYKDYVMTPIANAFNNAVSVWISKKGYTSSYYCFSTNSYDETVVSEDEFEEYIKYFEARLKG